MSKMTRIRRDNETWVAIIENWYEETFGGKKGWGLEETEGIFIGKTKRELGEKLLISLDYEAEMYILEENTEEKTRRGDNVDKLTEVILELIETPIE